MENYYTGYTKIIDNKTYYFVKKYIVFTAKENIPPVLENYGMHTDFNKACSIAQINDPAVRQQILSEIEGNIQHAKVIDLNNTEAVNKKKAR
jgi:hypothetical protein